MKKRKTTKKRIKFQQIYDGLNMCWVQVWSLAKEVPTPANMPSEILIQGQRYRVRYRPEIFNHPRKSAPLDGVVIFSSRLIIIDPDQGLHNMRQTLYHEACHVYFKERQLKDPRLTKITNAEIEGICDLFGESVYDLALNNTLPK